LEDEKTDEISSNNEDIEKDDNQQDIENPIERPQIEQKNIEDESENAQNKEKKVLDEKRSCLSGCFLPITVIFLIILAFGMIIHAKRGVIIDWLAIRIISNTEKLVINNLPKDLDKKMVENTFDRAKKSIKEGTIDRQLANQAIKEYISTARAKNSDEIKKVEIEKLIKVLNDAMYPSD